MTDLLDKVPLGKTGLAVSRLCFGMAPIGDMPGTYGHSVSVTQAHATVNAVMDSEVNFLDTSRNYGMGAANSVLAK
jgi:D-threo-aldose 1-dehydrogenase